MSDASDTKERLRDYLTQLPQAETVKHAGCVRAVRGLVVHAAVSDVRVGDLVSISRDGGALCAEVVGLQGDEALLLPFGELAGVGPQSEVRTSGAPLAIAAGDDLLGRVLDGLGEPIDGGPDLAGAGLQRWEVMRSAPHPLQRRRIERALSLGVRAIDGLCTVGEGQRVGLFAGSGLGKSMLMGQITRGTEADVVVICLVGERGREVRAFLEDTLGEAGLRRSVVVVATSEAPPMVRVKCAFTATAVAEYFREQGARVLLMMDSLTRFARAQRDAGLAAGELPVRHGYPASVFAALPKLVERAGNSDKGSMTAIYTVLLAGDDLREPIAEEAMALLDGHVVLDRRLAERGHWPAIDVLRSLSRSMSRLATPVHMAASSRFRRALSLYESHRDLISMGGYRHGSDPEVDEAIDAMPSYEDFLAQGLAEQPDMQSTIAQLVSLTAE